MFEKSAISPACERAINAIANGDKSALAVIYDKMHKLIYSVARSVLGNHEDAEDALQNTLCEILRCAPGYKGGNAKTWILAVARNQSLNIARRRAYETPDSDSITARTADDTESEFIYLDALSTLGEKEREAVVLKIYCHCRHKEIAVILGVSTASAEKLYQRGIAKLRDYYK